MRIAYVYMLASKKRGTLYIGVTTDLARRLIEHQKGIGSKFAKQYGCRRLVWFEEHEHIDRAITREKTMKKWPRQWKVNAIEAVNPDRNDLSQYLI
ncbi:MAG: GIY-YIG nuclease family protein [Hyphomicrobiales bacterium]